MNEILISYIEDLRDSILLFNESLIQVQNGAKDKDTINDIFRVAHTIKGNSGAMNFLKIQKVMHTMEDLLSEVRSGARELTDDMVPVLFACHDLLEDFLEVVQNQPSDESMDTDSLLQRLTALKENRSSSATAAPVKSANTDSNAAAVSDSPIKDMDLGIGMPLDIWELMHQNTKNGMGAYKLDIYFLKNSSMKAVRSWMIFDRIDHSAITLYSNPARLSESSINSAESTPFDANVINIIILSEQEVNELLEDLNSTPDVEKVEIKRISTSVIAERTAFVQKQKAVIGDIQEICVEVLGIDVQFINEDILKNIIGRMEKLVQSNIAHESSPITICAKRMVLALQEAVKNKRRVSVDQSENIVFLCQTIEECVMSPSVVKNTNFVSTMYGRLDDLIEAVTSPDKRIGDILTSQGLIHSSDEEAIVQRSKDEGIKFAQAAVKEGLVSAYDVLSALNTQKNTSKLSDKPPVPADVSISSAAKKTPAASAAAGESGFVKVAVSKVDILIDLLSELLIYNSQLEQSTSQLELEDSKFTAMLSRTEKLIKDIQLISMSLRMIEVKPTFHKLSRIIRDTATDLGKKISISLEGEDTEIDRSAVEKLYAPLMHMVRNAVSHGIEDTEDERTAVGKKSEGQVTISAYSQRNNVYIEVKDDGRGINTKKVYEKAKKLGIINDNREYTDQEIFKFIFLPGFSTQENVDNVSGRGVGMNVVEEAVSKLGGKIEIDSEMGVGSAFRVKLPINLAVVNGIIVEMAGCRYIIPTVCVKQFFTAKSENWVSLQGENRAIKLEDGRIISLISKEKIFGLPDVMMHTAYDPNSADKDKEYEMVLLEADQKLLILHVDKIVSRQDVVSKPLAIDFASVPYANSASILGDGIVSLILDIDAIFKMSLTN